VLPIERQHTPLSISRYMAGHFVDSTGTSPTYKKRSLSYSSSSSPSSSSSS
jgi:hypothetical protein